MNYREFAVDLAERAGDVMTTNFRLGMSKTWKSDGTPLTVSDIMINDMVLKAVDESCPGHAVIAEEASTDDVENHEWVWICDPIDGTVPFSHGLPTFTFSLALVHNGEPVLGVINDPMSELLLIAEKGKGATVNGVPAHVTSGHDFNTLVIAVEDAKYDSLATGAFRSRLRQRGAILITLWSAVTSASRVATGDIAAMVNSGGHCWDAAAVALIATEAGGKATDLRGEPIKFVEPFGGFVVSNGDIHDTLLDELARVIE